MQLFPACFQTRSALIEARLNVYHTELAVLNFAMGRHHPNKIDGMSWNRNIRMKPARHYNGITIANDADELRIFRV